MGCSSPLLERSKSVRLFSYCSVAAGAGVDSSDGSLGVVAEVGAVLDVGRAAAWIALL